MKALILSFILLFSLTSFANSDALEFVRSNLTKHKQIKGNFKQVREVKDLKVNLESQGAFEFKMPLDLKWNQKSPFALDILMTPDKIIQKNKDGSEQVMTKADQPVVFMFSSSFLGIFSGDEKLLNQNFIYQASGQGKSWDMILEPKDELMKKAISNVRVEGSEYVRSVIVTEKSGNKTTIVFSNVKGF